MQYITNIFGQAYGTCSYGDSSFQNGSCATATTSSSPSSGNILTNTGFDIALIVTVACVIALAAVLVRFWKRPAQGSSG